MPLHHHPRRKEISCNVCETYYQAPNGAHELIYKGQVFNTQELKCPHCERHPQVETTNLIGDTPRLKLKDWGAF